MSDKKFKKTARKDKQQNSVCAIPWFNGFWSGNHKKNESKNLPKIKHHATVKAKETLTTKGV